MNETFLLALRPEVALQRLTRADGAASEHLAAPWGAIPLPRAGTPERRPVDRLLHGPARVAELDDLAAAAGTTGWARWMLWSARARARGLFCCRLTSPAGAWLADFVAISESAPDFALAPPEALSGTRIRLSRFAALHRGANGMIVESPCATVRAELSADALTAVTACSVPAEPAGEGEPLSRTTTTGDAAARRALIAALLAGGLLREVGEDGLLAEDRDPVLAQWEFHDLLLHARTRTARPDEPRGGTYRFAAVRPAPQALKYDRAHPAGARDSGGSHRIPLKRPDLAVLMGTDPPLATVMEERASRREAGPVTAEQLGEFLYRTMRVRGRWNAGEGAHAYPVAARPYPSAGGMYELIAYLAIHACRGIPAGLYRYDPLRHELDRVAEPGADVEQLLAEGGRAAALAASPPLLVILAADFRRLSWKYEGIAYALTLKNVGVLLNSMQLAATAMGLGSCPLGAGDSGLFARAAGTSALEESSVGEFLLGS